MQPIFQKALTDSLHKYKDSIAIDTSDRLITYAELLLAGNTITRFLQCQGAVRENIIGILIDDRADLISCIIGVANAGCVFVPIDPTLPDARVSAMLSQMKPQAVISAAKYASRSVINEAVPSRHYCFEEIFRGAADEVTRLPIQYPQYDAEDALYIYFTSGTTGKPKGIVGRNCSLLQFLFWEIECFKIDGHCRCSQFISPYFDAFLRDIFVPLLSGGTICIPPAQDDFFTPENMIPWIDEKQVTMIHCVPSVFRLFNNRKLTSLQFTKLKHIFLSGERIVPAELEQWYSIFDERIELINFYGATETTMIRAYYIINRRDTKNERIPIGYPIWDTELIIVNADLQPCNTLVVGDLYIVSKYISKGYLNNPQLNSERFVTLPAASLREKAFKTGDKARRLPSGAIDLLGREDNQVKIRGIRIELSEIENALVSSKYAGTAVCTKITQENGEDALVAFVTREPGLPTGFSILSLLELHLQTNLPAYMMPSKIIETAALPLLGNGKIDYKALTQLITNENIIAPENELQAQLLATWKELLGDKPISIDDSFQSRGGNSLSMMRLIGRIYKLFHVRISLAQLFDNLTIRKQAQWMQTAKNDTLFVIDKAAEMPRYPLSLAQERIYYSCKLDGTSTVYNLPMAWQITGSYDKNRIESMIRQLIARHESLRTEFRIDNGTLCQVIQHEVHFALQERSFENDDVQASIAACMQPFDLAQAPLIRGWILHIGTNQTMFMIDLHHIICDGMSETILSNEFMQLYQGEDLVSCDFQYKDYAAWEQGFRETHDYLRLREFWLSMFEGNIPSLALPSVNIGIKEVGYEGGNVDFEISRTIIDDIAERCGDGTVTKSSVLFSFFYLYLAQLSGQEDITIGLAVSGRFQHEIERVVGMFVKTLPIRYRLSPEMTFKEFVTDIHKLLVQAGSHQAYDLANMVDELNKNREEPVGNLFSALFAFQNFEERRQTGVATDFPAVELKSGTSKYPLSLTVNEATDNYTFRLEYASLYFTSSDAELLAESIKLLINNIVDNVDRPVMEIVSSNQKPQIHIEDDIIFDFAVD